MRGRVVRGDQWALAELALDRELYMAPFQSIPLLGRFIMREVASRWVSARWWR